VSEAKRHGSKVTVTCYRLALLHFAAVDKTRLSSVARSLCHCWAIHIDTLLWTTWVIIIIIIIIIISYNLLYLLPSNAAMTSNRLTPNCHAGQHWMQNRLDGYIVWNVHNTVFGSNSNQTGRLGRVELLGWPQCTACDYSTNGRVQEHSIKE